MTQSDQIVADVAANTAGIAALGTALADLATNAHKEIADLARAVAALGTTDPAVTDALAALEAGNARLQALAAQTQGINTDLTADDVPAPVEPAP